jgi:CcdB protein.
MARFWVYRLKSEDQLAIDLQSNFLDDLPSRVMAPLYPGADLPWVMARLTPRFTVDGKVFVMATQRMSSIPVSEIGPAIADLSHKADEITAATDFLFQGF